MIAINNQQAYKENFSNAFLIDEGKIEQEVTDLNYNNVQTFCATPTVDLNLPTSLHLSRKPVTHAVHAGLNPLVDAGSHLFSILGKLKLLSSFQHLNKLQKELVAAIHSFQETIKNLGYKNEYLLVCRYILCATLDDIIGDTAWGQNHWENYSLLATFKQDTRTDKFFSILERALKEPVLYIDLMELIYICLSMGFKGQYRSTEHSQYQLEQITNNLYKHIRAYRGNFSKYLSPTPLKIKPTHKQKHSSRRNFSLLFVFFVSACIVMAIFICLGYLMDVVSNEAYQNLARSPNIIPHEILTK